MSRKHVVVPLICLCIGLAAGVGSAQPEERPIITVLDFKASSISTSEVEIFVDYLTSHIVETNVFRVIDRSQRQSILEELEFAASDCTDESCQLEIGKMLAASQIIVGSIGKVGDRYLLSIKLIDVQTGQTLRSEARNYPRLETLVGDTKRIARDFARKQETGPGTSEVPAAVPEAPGGLPRHSLLFGDIYRLDLDENLVTLQYHLFFGPRWGAAAEAGVSLDYNSLYAPSFFLAAGAEVMAFGPIALGLRLAYFRFRYQVDFDYAHNHGIGFIPSLLLRYRSAALGLEGGYVFALSSEPYGGSGEYYGLNPYFLGLSLGINFEGGPEARAAARLAKLRHSVLAGAGLIEFSLNASYVLSWARMMGVTVGLGYGLQPDRYYAAAGGLLFPWEWLGAGLRIGYARAGLEGNAVCLEPLLLLRYKWLALALSTVQPSYSLVSFQAGVSF